jgi:hypothetical protein
MNEMVGNTYKIINKMHEKLQKNPTEQI